MLSFVNNIIVLLHNVLNLVRNFFCKIRLKENYLKTIFFIHGFAHKDSDSHDIYHASLGFLNFAFTNKYTFLDM